MQQIRDYLFSDLRTNDIHITPAYIVEEMVNALPADLWNDPTLPEKKFLDICCKSGIFLIKLRDKLMTAPAMVKAIEDDKKRLKHILKDMLYGIAPCKLCEDISRIELYGKVYEHGNIVTIAANYKNYIELFKLKNVVNQIKDLSNKKFLKSGDNKEMTFDVVVGNPPYNNDTYLDFVQLGHKLAKQYTCMITPAKWQAKGGKKNEQFRKEIVPYMENIVCARAGHDIFDIDENSGIAYYTIDSCKHKTKNVKNICTFNKVLSSDFEEHDEQEVVLYNRKILSIIGKVGTLGGGFKQSLYVKNTDHGEPTIAAALGGGFKQSLYVKNTDHGEPTIAAALGFKRQTYVHEQDRGYESLKGDIVEVMQGENVCGYKLKNQLYTKEGLDKWKCTCSCMMGYGAMFNGKDKIVGSPYINVIGPNQVPKGSFPVLKYFDTELEAKSFKSYVHSSLVCFLFFLGICGATITPEFWRFVPDPVKFDHIFTDQELYAKYNLTEDEIEIIESIIKKRITSQDALAALVNKQALEYLSSDDI